MNKGFLVAPFLAAALSGCGDLAPGKIVFSCNNPERKAVVTADKDEALLVLSRTELVTLVPYIKGYREIWTSTGKVQDRPALERSARHYCVTGEMPQVQ